MSYEKLYQISFAIATLFAFTMFSSNLETTQRVYSAKNEVKASTGVLETKKDGSKNLPKIIGKIIPQASASEKEPLQNTVTAKNVEKKPRTPYEIYEQVKHLGYREEPTIALISTCKSSSSDIQKCILFGLIIMYNESGNKQNSNACINKNNCLGVKSGKISYSSLDEGMENWVQIFNRYWHKAESPSFFYSEKGKLSKSRYCVSESSSNTEIGCPNGLSIANKKYEQLYPIIYLN